MPALADAGYYVVAPDQRGYGATTGWDASFDGDLAPFRPFNLVRDVLGIVAALGYERVHAVIGHDAGAGVAGWCSLLRPDIFSAVAMMSAPFSGPPRTPSGAGRATAMMAEFDARLAALEPPRKHYQWYYSSRRANADMMECRQGLHVFLRGYYHHKSADWPGNRPYRLRGWTATELAKLPTYYVMNRGDTMPEAVTPFTPSPAAAAACRWLPDEDLAVFCSAYAATGFQGGLQWYRCGTARRRGGASSRSSPGGPSTCPPASSPAPPTGACSRAPAPTSACAMRYARGCIGCHLLPGAGHWVQQEQPERVAELLLEFLRAAAGA